MTTVLDALTACWAWVLAHPAYAWPLITALVTIIFKPRTPAQYAAMVAMRPVWLWSRVAPLLQVIGALGLDPVKVLAVIGKVFTGKQDSAGRPPMGGLVVMLALTCALTTGACKGVSTPSGADVEAGAGVASGVCSLIDGIDDSGVVRTICATVAEVAQVVEFILTLRTADAGAPSAACKPLPGSALCATSAERAKGVLFVTHVRARLLTLDGGTP